MTSSKRSRSGLASGSVDGLRSGYSEAIAKLNTKLRKLNESMKKLRDSVRVAELQMEEYERMLSVLSEPSASLMALVDRGIAGAEAYISIGATDADYALRLKELKRVRRVIK